MPTSENTVTSCLASMTEGVPSRATRAIATAAIGVLAAASLIPVLDGSAPSWARVVDPVVAVVSVALIPVLFRRPLDVAVTLALLATVSPAATTASTAALAAVALRYRMRWGLPVALLGIAAHAVQGVVRPAESLGYGWWLLLVVAVHAAILGGAVAFANHLALIRSLRERAERAEADQAARLAEARRAERDRIAREMHDVLAHRLSLVATYAGALEYRPDASPHQLATAAGVVRDGIHRALQELRDVIDVLRFDDNDDLGNTRTTQAGLSDLDELVAETRAAGTPVHVRSDLDSDTLPPLTVDRTAYRVAQEGLTNARKHAPGEPVSIRIAGAPGDVLTVEMENSLRDGRSTTAAAFGAGSGLTGLTERAALVGGSLSHDITDGRFRVHLEVPWPR